MIFELHLVGTDKNPILSGLVDYLIVDVHALVSAELTFYLKIFVN